MKTLVATAVALSFVAGLAGHADATTYRKKKRLHATYYGQPRVSGYRDNDDNAYGYYEHRLDAVRFGSKRWWSIYEEQNGRRR
jgi:hypothetical protein